MIADFPRLKELLTSIKTEQNNCCIKSNYLKHLKDEWLEVQLDFDSRIKEMDKNSKLSIFIRNVQNDFSEFLEELYSINEQFSPCSESCQLNQQDYLTEIATEVSQILESLKLRYPEYFDFKRDIPYWVLTLNRKSVPVINRITHNLNSKKISQDLIKIINEYLICLYKPNRFKLRTWAQFYYLEELSYDLTYFAESLPSKEDNTRLLKLLIGRNFNPLEFYEYILEYIASIIPVDKPYEEQEMEMIMLLKEINNTRIETLESYNTETMSILDSICNYINRELETIAKMKEVLSSYSTNGAARNSNFYFEVNTTIEELFFLTRVMLEVRMIKTKFKANLYTFVSRHIKTDRSKSPSLGYMRNVFSPNQEIPAKTIRKIRAWLMNMVNYIDDNYGNQLKLIAVSMSNIAFAIEFVKLMHY